MQMKGYKYAYNWVMQNTIKMHVNLVFMESFGLLISIHNNKY